MKFRDYLANKWIRIVLMIGFFLFVYKILYAIGVFFAIDTIILSMYMCWTGMIVLFGSLLPVKKYMFTANDFVVPAIPPAIPVMPPAPTA